MVRGHACLATGVPGEEDWKGFHLEAAARGALLVDPRTVRADPGRARALAAVYSELAGRGVPYDIHLEFTPRSERESSDARSQMGSTSLDAEVIEVTTAPVSDTVFEVSAARTGGR